MTYHGKDISLRFFILHKDVSALGYITMNDNEYGRILTIDYFGVSRRSLLRDLLRWTGSRILLATFTVIETITKILLRLTMSYREEFLSRTSNPIPIAVFFPPQGQSSLKYNVPIAEIQVSYIQRVL
jgi:hypothetical protein